MSVMPKPDFVELVAQQKKELRELVGWVRQWLPLAEKYLSGLDSLDSGARISSAVKPDTFKGVKGLPAIITYLNMEQRPRSRKQIIECLIRGGYSAGVGK